MSAVAKPVLPLLQTPKSASFPSEIIDSPLLGLAGMLKQEDGLKTPITPPVAYTEFLKALTPVLTSPPPTSALPRSLSSDGSSGRNTPTSVPSTSTCFSFNRPEGYKSPLPSAPLSSSFGPSQPGQTPTALRRLRIPQSPLYSPGVAQSPRSASMARSPFSPADWGLDSSGHRYFEAPRSACVRPVSVRSVVTRTVTYTRTPLDPAPKGKKRKLEETDMPPPPPATAPPAPSATATTAVVA